MELQDHFAKLLSYAHDGTLSDEKYVRHVSDLINCKDHLGRTAFMHAAIGDNVKVVSFLIRKGIDLFETDNQGCTALHWAARCGSIAVIKETLTAVGERGRSLVLAKNIESVTPLHVAAANGSYKMLKVLERPLEKEKDTVYEIVKDERGRSPLHYAASRANLDCVKYFLDQDSLYFPVDHKDKFGLTPLMCAVGVKMPQAKEICDLLVKRKRAAALLRNQDGQFALHLAVAAGNLEVVKLLVCDHDLQLDAVDLDNRTPLHYAAEQGEVDIIKILLDKNAGVVNRDKLGAVPAHYAAQTSKEALEMILEKSKGMTRVLNISEKNLAPEVRDNEGRTCLMWAVCAGNEEVVSYLLQREVDRKEADNKGYTALHLAAMTNQESMCKLLVRQGWNPSERDQQNNTPMHLAAGRGHVEVVRSLVTMSANMNDKDAVGRTPIFWPFLGGQPHTAHVMIKELGFEWRTAAGRNSVPFTDNCGRTPLHAAAFSGYPACITILLSIESADTSLKAPLIGWPDQNGQTALHVASQRGTLDCVKLLVRSGAGLNALDYDRRTPLDFAIDNKHEHVIQYLKGIKALTGEAVEFLAASTIQRFFKRNFGKIKYLP